MCNNSAVPSEPLPASYSVPCQAMPSYPCHRMLIETLHPHRGRFLSHSPQAFSDFLTSLFRLSSVGPRDTCMVRINDQPDVYSAILLGFKSFKFSGSDSQREFGSWNIANVYAANSDLRASYL
ncbi:hypothetical protein TrVFT333_005041 [Trichoderma virens FT-333]|nr:hypothetical protein TrVFT333_005041 [Trichoderma virens FT-333]